MNKLLLGLLILSLLSLSAHSQNYYDVQDYYSDEEYYMSNNDCYCAPKNTSIWTKIKDSFLGQPTGYTPPIMPSQYINNFGPSYMQGFYGSNGWNNHNIYNPIYSGAGVNILN